MKNKLLLATLCCINLSLNAQVKTIGSAQQSTVSPPSRSINAANIAPLNQPKAINCTDTISYPFVKQVLLGPDGISGFYAYPLWQSDNDAFSMTFNSYNGMTVSGVEFLGRRATSGPTTINVRASIFNVDANNNPIGSALASGVRAVSSTAAGFYYVNFSTPLLITGSKFAIVLDVQTVGGIFESFMNSALTGELIDEDLCRYRSNYAGVGANGTWQRPIDLALYTDLNPDFEPIVGPIVSYPINTTGTVAPTSACLGQPVTFTNTTTTGQLSDRMYSFNKFANYFGLATADSTFVWDTDNDQNVNTNLLADLIWSGTATHTYTNAGTYSPEIISLGGLMNTNCVDYATYSVTINPVQDATFNYTSTSICAGSANITPAAVTTSGGTFTSTTGLVFANATTGEINVAGSTSGTYVVTYTTAGPCSATSTQSITIAQDNATFNYVSSTICEGGSNVTPATVATPGGTFSSTTGLVFANATTGEIDVTNSTSGNYVITYTTAGACPTTSTQSLTITSAPDATFTYAAAQYCSTGTNPSPVLTGTAGIFTSTTGLSINSTGVINLAASTPGTYTVTNTIAASGTCAEAVETFVVEIFEAGNAAFTYVASTYCMSGTNPSPVITGTAGTFSSTAGLTIDAAGVINLAGSDAGTYTVTNEVAANGACPIATATAQITVTANPDAAFTYAESVYCATGSTSPTITGAAGTFTSTPAGLSINGTSGAINLAGSDEGTYTITNTIAATATCAQATATATVTVDEVPTATTTLSGITLTATETGVTYQWINCAGNTPVAGETSQTFTPSAPGSYAVVITDGNCSATSACITVSNVGVEDKSIEMVTVYPNPTENTITISGLEVANAVVSILDVNGRVLLVENTTATTLELSVRDFEAGVYFIAVTSDSINGTKRFIKK